MRSADRSWARARRKIAQEYDSTARLLASEDGAAVNVCIGLAVIAGIAASDAICAATMGERYSGSDHGAAADVLGRVDAALGRRLRTLAELKAASHYGGNLLTAQDRDRALRAAAELVREAAMRVP